MAEYILIKKSEAKLLRNVIAEWKNKSIITLENEQVLLSSFKEISFQWERLATIAGIISVLCGIIGFGSLIIDNIFIEFISKIFPLLISIIDLFVKMHPIARAIIFGLLAMGIFYVGYQRKLKYPHNYIINEIILVIGTFLIYCTFLMIEIVLMETLEIDKNKLDAINIYKYEAILCGIIGFLIPSSPVWFIAINKFTSSIGSGHGYYYGIYYIYMENAHVVLIFGIFLIIVGVTANNNSFECDWLNNRLKTIQTLTRFMGNLLLYISLLILARKLEWILYSAIISILSILYGLKMNDEISFQFGQIFLIINIYTRFFEIFWGRLHKGIFFVIIAVSLFIISKLAQDQWKKYRAEVLNTNK